MRINSSPVAMQKPIAHYYVVALSPPVVSPIFLRWISVGEGSPLPRPRIQVGSRTVPQKCAVTHFQHGQVFCAPALGNYAVARCRLIKRVPRGDTQLMWFRIEIDLGPVPTMLTTRSAPAALA